MSSNIGFHPGEVAVQSRAGTRDEALSLVGMLAPPAPSRARARFLAERTFAAITARDRTGRLWTVPLAGPDGFLELTDDRLVVHAGPGGPLADLPGGQQVGLIAIDLVGRRRFRVNGTLDAVRPAGLSIAVDQAFGNCPQYIQSRELVPSARQPLDPPQEVHSAEVARIVRTADTFFVGTTHPDRGTDTSHRGGPAGFVRIQGAELWWPDYPGNNMFNSLGNLAVDDTAAMLVPDFTAGRMLHLTGTARVEWTEPGSPGDDGGTGRRVHLTIRQAVVSPAPVTAGGLTAYPANPPVTA